MSFDIDVLLRVKAREREAVDRIKTLLSKSLAYTPNKDASFRYEKNVDGNIVQLDLLTDLPRDKEDEAILKVYGANTSLDLCGVDGAEDLKDPWKYCASTCAMATKWKLVKSPYLMPSVFFC